MRGRRAGRTATALAVAIGINPASGLLAQTPTASYARIQHVIVVMQSGHSFDNYFGTRPGVTGLVPGTCLGNGFCVRPHHLTPDTARSGLANTVKVTSQSINGVQMNGFVSA